MPIEFSTNKSKVDAQGYIDVTLSPTASSGSPPIGNAAEFYSVHKKMAATLDSNGAFFSTFQLQTLLF